MRIIKIGDQEHPATREDIEEVQKQLKAVANNPNLTFTSHFILNFDNENNN